MAAIKSECQEAVGFVQEAKSRGSVPYILDRNGTVLAAQDLNSGLPVYPCDFWTAHLVGWRTAGHARAGLEEAMGEQLRHL